MFVVKDGQRSGVAFTMPTRVGHLVGVATDELPRIGTLVWIATPTFETEPTLGQVQSIHSWRWPTLFPLGAALRRKIVKRVGMLAIPPSIAEFPVMRSGGGFLPWVAFARVNGEDVNLGPTQDRSLPIYQIVNDTSLREKVETGWMPDDTF
jgi:hypothetical protein